MTEVVYSTRKHPFAEGRTFQNPRLFTGPVEGVTKVFIEGSFPAVEKAYAKAGVVIEKLGPTGPSVADAPEKATKAQIAEELAARGVDADPKKATKAELIEKLDEAKG